MEHPKIARSAALRTLRQPTPSEKGYAICYVKKDGSLGQKQNVSTQRNMPKGKAGVALYKYSLNDNACLLLFDHNTQDFFAIKHHLITHFNGFEIDHNK